MKYLLISLLFVFSLAFAQGFNGTFQNDQGTGQITLQQTPDGGLQGSFTGSNGQMQLQGYADVQGAYGSLMGQEAQLAFQAQLSPDGNTLQMLVAPFGQDGQPDVNAAQQLIYHRVAGTRPIVQNPVPAPTPLPTPNPVPVTPQPLPMPVNPAPNPLPQPAPNTSLGGMPQPPQTPWQGNYQLAVYSQSNPSQKKSGILTIQVTPQPEGNYRSVSTINGQTLVDMVVTAAGIDTATGQEQFPLSWNTGQSSVYGVSGQRSTQNGLTLFSLQSGQDGAQAMYDANGVLVSYRGCISGECTEMRLGQ
jgi:hypothetical protein